MFCQNCGAKNDNESAFCTTCGATLDKTQLEAAKAAERQRQARAQQAKQNSPKQNQPKQGGTTNGISNAAPARPRTRKEAIKAGQLTTNRRPPSQPINLSPKLIAVMVEAAAFLLVVLLLTTVVNDKFSAEKIAESYFVYLANGDYEAAYELLDIEENAFVNQETFTNYARQVNLENLSNYQVAEQSAGMGSEDVLGKSVSILYRNQGEETDRQVTINMIRSPKSKLIFFDDWSVAYSSILCTDCTIVVPNDAKLVIDGVAVDGSYIAQDDYDAAYNDSYRIPQLFLGNHTVEVSMEGMETIRQNMNVSSSSVYNEYTNMYCTEETSKELQTLAVNNLYRIYDAAIKGKAFEEIAPLFTSNADDLSYIQDNYYYLVENLSESIQVNAISFSNISAYSNTASTYVDVSYNYSIDGLIQDWWSGDWVQDTIQGNEYSTFNFVKEDGEWVQRDLSCPYLY